MAGRFERYRFAAISVAGVHNQVHTERGGKTELEGYRKREHSRSTAPGDQLTAHWKTNRGLLRSIGVGAWVIAASVANISTHAIE